MHFSKFGQKFTQKSGILQLMEDLGKALASDKPVNMLGGGNPAAIANVNAIFQQAYADHADSFIESAGNYSTPQGDGKFIQALVDFLNRQYSQQWQQTLTTANIALTNGSQNGFFYLLNLFAGDFSDGSNKKILLPLAPEYVGYTDAHVDGHHFIASKPTIADTTYKGQTGFYKYHVNFEDVEAKLKVGDVGAICCSRPTNPTGNVLTDDEIAHLDTLAKQYDIPFIIDSAYGIPFPNILFTQANLTWNNNTILCLSLSKIGLPGLRTGIIVANEKVIEAISAMNAIINLSPVRFAATLTTPLLQNDGLKTLSDKHIRPFYQQKVNYAIELLKKELGDTPMKIHEPEGAIFLWLWFENLPISTYELYEQLKAAGTIVLPGEYFFPGVADIANYRHAHECIRISYAQPDDTLEKGIAMIGEWVRKAYAQG